MPAGGKELKKLVSPFMKIPFMIFSSCSCFMRLYKDLVREAQILSADLIVSLNKQLFKLFKDNSLNKSVKY